MKLLHIFLLYIGSFAVIFSLCRALIWKWENYENYKNDERQAANQGKAGKTAFTVVMLYLITVLLLRFLEWETEQETFDSLLWLGVLFGAGVYATITIWTDAYTWLRTKWKTVVTCLMVCAALHLYDYFDGVVVQWSNFTNLAYWLKMAAGVFFLYLALLVYIRMKVNERE